MRILWHSNARHVPSGYGNQTNVFVPRIRDLGHEVIVSGYYGTRGALTHDQDGILTLPEGREKWGNDVLIADAEHYEVDIVITLMDAWVLRPEVMQQVKWYPWLPIDHDPVPPKVANVLKAAQRPIAYSEFGLDLLAEFDPLYVPHGIDCEVFRPLDDARQELGFPSDAFIVGIVATNIGRPGRKCFDQQIRAFAEFQRNHPSAMLYLHTEMACPVGEDLEWIIEQAGIPSDVIAIIDQYRYRRGMISQGEMAQIYSSLDVLLNATGGEGFGLPILEAQACGTQVIVTNFSSMPDLVFGGWAVKWDENDKFLTPQGSYQVLPPVSGIVDALERAWVAQDDDFQTRAGAEEYDADLVTREYWEPVLTEIANG